MKRERLGIVVFLAGLTAFGLSPGVFAGEENPCEDPDIYGTYTPEVVVTPKLINAVLDLVGEIGLEGFHLQMPFNLLCKHTIYMTTVADSYIALQNVNFSVPGIDGGVTVNINMDGDSAYPILMGTALVETTNDCEDWGCIGCGLENLIVNAVSGGIYGFGFESGLLTQDSDVCITGDCEAVHAHTDTDFFINGFKLNIFGDSFFGNWLDAIASFLAEAAIDFGIAVADYFVDETEFPIIGLFTNIFGPEMKTTRRGCLPGPVQEVLDCRAEGSVGSTVGTGKRPEPAEMSGAVLYILPIVTMFGLIIWVRRRKAD